MTFIWDISVMIGQKTLIEISKYPKYLIVKLNAKQFIDSFKPNVRNVQ